MPRNYLSARTTYHNGHTYKIKLSRGETLVWFVVKRDNIFVASSSISTPDLSIKYYMYPDTPEYAVKLLKHWSNRYVSTESMQVLFESGGL